VGNFDNTKVPIEHFMLNFLPTIRKIKIDLLMNRRIKKDLKDRPVPAHLEDIMKKKIDPADFNYIDDITLAKYL
jgi:hypothetical protein